MLEQFLPSLRRMGNLERSYEQSTAWGYVPETKVKADDAEVTVTTEIPGIKKSEIQIEVKGEGLHIQAERRVDYGRDAVPLRRERRHAKYDRWFRLPYPVDVAKVEAEYENGVLRVRLPRSGEDKPKQISVA